MCRRVSRARCSVLHAASQNRDRTKRRRPVRPRLCSAPLRKCCALRCVRGTKPLPKEKSRLAAGLSFSHSTTLPQFSSELAVPLALLTLAALAVRILLLLAGL